MKSPLAQTIEAVPFIQTKEIKKHYKNAKNQVLAVDGVDVTIFQGETLGLVGESGCGKSTLGRVIVGLETATSGEIFYQNRSLGTMKGKERKNIRKEIQMIFQDPYSALNPRKTVGDILRAPLLYHGLSTKKQVDQDIFRLLDQVGLSKRSMNRYPHEFSGGQRQRICIAQALSLNPKVIICDEPVSALDVSIQAQILNLLKELQKEHDLTYLFIAHGLGAISYISDRVAVMYLGKIVEIAPTMEIFTRPLHPYTQALYSAAPVSSPHQREENKRILLQGEAQQPEGEKGCKFYHRCPYRMEKCKLAHPSLVQVEGWELDHQVACYYALETFKRKTRPQKDDVTKHSQYQQGGQDV
ncbi:MAG: ATP-binding cassette domain-containing protein [Clostridiales bacterium]|nr:ATP-binding cassette domain-containing protein [Clostridiales bacterium]